MSVFLDEISIWISRLRETCGLPWCGWASPTFFEGLDGTKREKKGEITLLACWAGTFIFSCPWTRTHTIGSRGSQASRLGMKPHHLLSRVSHLLIADRGLLSLHNQMREFLIINQSLISYWFCFSETPYYTKHKIGLIISVHNSQKYLVWMMWGCVK